MVDYVYCCRSQYALYVYIYMYEITANENITFSVCILRACMYITMNIKGVKTNLDESSASLVVPLCAPGDAVVMNDWHTGRLSNVAVATVAMCGAGKSSSSTPYETFADERMILPRENVKCER